MCSALNHESSAKINCSKQNKNIDKMSSELKPTNPDRTESPVCKQFLNERTKSGLAYVILLELQFQNVMIIEPIFSERKYVGLSRSTVPEELTEFHPMLLECPRCYLDSRTRSWVEHHPRQDSRPRQSLSVACLKRSLPVRNRNDRDIPERP